MQEVAYGMKVIGWYIIPLVAVIMTARKIFKLPDELFRKILHFVLLGAYIPFLFAFERWWVSAGVIVVVAVVCYPALALAGLIPAFSSFVNERKKGEYKSSMLLALGVMALCITVCWGIFDDKYLVLACVYAWGVGDAFAALIGKRFGKHKITWKFADNHKSVEGSLAMLITSAIAVFIVLIIRGGMHPLSCLLVSVVAASVCTVIELCSKKGLDTVSCPTAAMVFVIPLVMLLGGL